MAATIGDVIAYTKTQLGKPYVFGATGPNTFDCSGLMQYVWHHFGVNLPRTSQDQAKVGASVPISQIQPGDLVFSDWGDGANSHVGMAVGGGQIIDAPHAGANVRYDALTPGYLQHVTAVRRMTGESLTVTPGTAAPAGGGSDGGGFWGPVIQPFQDVASAARDVSTVANLITKAFMPSNIVRVVSGTIGMIFVMIGILFLAWEVKK